MKIIISAILVASLFCGKIYAQTGDSNSQTPETPKTGVVFKETVYNFKTVEYGSDVSHSYIFTNMSNLPITIKSVTPGCGCTTTEYTKGPIMPGKTGTISIKYDSSREGYFAKNVAVVVGDENYTLIFLGTVKPNPDGSKTTTKPQQVPIH
jgi:hypothetical protein